MKEIKLNISKNEALILYEFLSNLDKYKIEFEHKSEEIVLDNLLCLLEETLSEPFSTDYKKILGNVRNKILSD